MPRYLIQATYTAEGKKGLLKDGGTKRIEAATPAIEAVGGKVEAIYFAFGGADAIAILDMPDHASMAALALTVAGSGAVELSTTVLLTPEELDEASKKAIVYSPPGH